MLSATSLYRRHQRYQQKKLCWEPLQKLECFFHLCKRKNEMPNVFDQECVPFCPSCHSRVTPGMYQPRHIARLRDTTLLYHHHHHHQLFMCSNEKVMQSIFFSSFLALAYLIPTLVTECVTHAIGFWAWRWRLGSFAIFVNFEITISWFWSQVSGDNDEDEWLGEVSIQVNLWGAGAMFIAPSRPNVARESIPLSHVPASYRHTPEVDI